MKNKFNFSYTFYGKFKFVHRFLNFITLDISQLSFDFLGMFRDFRSIFAINSIVMLHFTGMFTRSRLDGPSHGVAFMHKSFARFVFYLKCVVSKHKPHPDFQWTGVRHVGFCRVCGSKIERRDSGAWKLYDLNSVTKFVERRRIITAIAMSDQKILDSENDTQRIDIIT